MQRYKNLSGNSGVLAFETGPDYIIMQFKDETYEYTTRSTGAENIGKMKNTWALPAAA